MNIKTVAIIGGGSSGWMTAAALAKLCPHLEVTLIESEKIGTIGVGESTLGHINRFLEMLGLKDEDWMAACNATYKNSIRFTNFRDGKGESFEYPFVQGYDTSDVPDGSLETWSKLATMYPEDFPPESFAETFATTNAFLAKHNRQSNNKDGKLRHYSFRYDTAYHMDAQLFGQYLKEKIALPLGVKHIYGDVHSYIKDQSGNIVRILNADGTMHSADLWIDCTGFKSQLLELWMGSEFVPFSKHLANDKALACRIPYTNRKVEMENVTDCTALGNGWVWNIPLWNRIGTGYVYSSRFITKEQAEAEFRDYLKNRFNNKIALEAKIFSINIRHGYRKRAWVGNVVGIGLSYGFVEPLESTGLLTTHENVIRLVETLNRRQGLVTRTERDAFNYGCENSVLGFRDFVSMHYAFSGRSDTHYWKWCTEINEYHPTMFNEFVPQNNSYTNLLASMVQSNSHNYDMQGPNFIMAGMGMKVVSTPELIKSVYNFHAAYGDFNVDLLDEPLEDVRKKIKATHKSAEDYIKGLPTNYEYLLENIYNGIDQYLDDEN